MDDYKPGMLIKNPKDDETVVAFLRAATTNTTAIMNATRVEADVHLARAFSEAAEASSSHAKSLARATWALVAATCLLCAVALVQLLK